MKILLLSHEMTYTGAPNSLLNVARVLRSHGHSVKVYTLTKGPFSVRFNQHGFRVRKFDISKCKKISENFDIAVCNTVFCGKAALAMQDFIPTVLYLREAENLPDILAKNHIDEGCICNAEHIACVSEYAAHFIEKTYRPENLYILHNFLIKPLLKTATLNKAKKKIRFLIAATIEPRKGISVAIKAFEMLPPELRKKAVLDIYGSAPSWAASYHKPLFAKKHEGVTYHGELTHGKSRMYKKTNVVLVPSFDESCSLTALEGAMYARPIIVTENVGAKYIVDGNGFVVKTGSAESLSRAMAFFIKHSSELETAGSISYENFGKYADKDDYYTGLNKIFQEIM